MIKKLAVMLFLFVSAAIAQQPAEWRPSVAEDNKAATWEDTSTFMVNALTAHGRSYTRLPFYNKIQKGYSAPSRCTLGELNFIYEDGVNKAMSVTLDFGKVDPLSIKVAPFTVQIDYGTLQVWSVSLAGTNDGAIAFGKGVARGHAGFEDLFPQNTIKPILFKLDCESSEKHCAPVNKTYPVVTENFEDIETAKRFARAAMHAALLCGGAKAVSPF